MNVEYNLFNNKNQITFEIQNKDSIDWKFLDECNLRLNDKIKVSNNEAGTYFSLNLYQKNVNLHVFSVVASQEYSSFGLDYPFYLVWIDNANVFTFVQENVKSDKLFDDLNGIELLKVNIDDFMNSLFRNPPLYYLDSTSRSKSIKNLNELPLQPYKSVSSSTTQYYKVGEDGKMEPSNIECVSMEPI